jgi:succinate dehydrogenase / fumarate reductase cytochrome b subunit
MAHSDRPLSPHLGIYRWEISNSLSILHRMTGVMLSAGGLALVVWLVSVVAGNDVYSLAHAGFGSLPGLLLLFGWTFCFFYHLGNGVRHLFWDVGLGFEKHRARATGWIVVVFAIVMTFGFWALALGRGSA